MALLPPNGAIPPHPAIAHYWAEKADRLAAALASGPGGLTSLEAATRLTTFGRNELRERRPLSRWHVLVSQLRNPLLLLLVAAALASALTGEWVDATIVLVVVIGSAALGTSREYGARAAAAALRARIHTRTTALRDGQPVTVPVEEVVPGDVVCLAAGSLVPADAVVLEAQDFFVSQSVLTGESYPVLKTAAISPSSAALHERTNCVYLGTNVRSGTGRCLVVATGPQTEYGAIARRLTLRAPETEFDRGIRRFGYLLTIAMLLMILVVFAAHTLSGRAPVETLLFAVALAVGLSPELLPAILSVNLARGAQSMARAGVLVRRLSAIENLGSMDVLCTDKTGTLTEGTVRLAGAFDPDGMPSAAVLGIAAINASLEAGLSNPLDDAILEAATPDLAGVRKLAEVPFDFVRRRSSVVVTVPGRAGARLLTKGAYTQVIDVCSRLSPATPLDAQRRAALDERLQAWSQSGTRVLAVAARDLDLRTAYGRDDEDDMTLLGFVTFFDLPKPGVKEEIADLAALGVSVKIITGDHHLVARHVATLVGVQNPRVLTGGDLDELRDEALWRAAEHVDIFAEVDPNQKERIILSLKRMGHVVGFLGDGVNDAPAMHAADTSLSVDSAVDVAREAADFVLLERHLGVITRGIEEGRRTFANTLKYVLTTTSANLGNMASMAAASFVLPFLPLTAGQILLNNFLSDIPAVGLAGDTVDPEWVSRPRRWNMRFIGRFMVEFGALSSAFDLLTFVVLLGLFHAGVAMFQTAWFIESLLTELTIALVVRTRRPLFTSRPGALLLGSTAVLVPLTFALPYLPGASVFGFVPLPGILLASLCVVTVLYVAAAELTKAWFYRQSEAADARRMRLMD